MLATTPTCCSLVASSGTEDPLASILQSPSPSIVISCSQQAASISSFDWTDFPVIVEEDPFRNLPPIPCHLQADSNAELQSSCCCSSEQELRPPSPKSVTASLYTAPAAAKIKPATAQEPIQQPCLQKKRLMKHVTFANIIRVRTHNVILGDHPCCRDGMALVSSDWTLRVDAKGDELIDLDLFETASLKRKPSELRLTYSERRARLQATTGLTASELCQEKCKLVFTSGSSCDYKVGSNSCLNSSPRSV